MADFGIAVALVLKHEGGYVDDPRDSGGETNFGISKRAYPGLDIKNLTMDEAAAIYKRDYWQAIEGDSIQDQELANEALDFAVNAGTKAAIDLLSQTQDAYKFAILRIRRYKTFHAWSFYGASWAGRAVDF